MKEKKKENKKIKRGGILGKYFIIYSIFFVLIVGPVGFGAYKEIAELGLQSLQRRLLCVASAASTVIDANKHEKIVSRRDEDTSFYREALLPLKKITGVMPVISSIYTVRLTEKENTVIFVLDTAEEYDADGDGKIEDNETKAHVGEEYDIGELPAFRKAFTEPAVDEEINCDKWGCWLSAYAPIRDSTGRVVAAVGVDMSADEVKTRQAAWQKLFVYFILFCFLASFVVIQISYRVFFKPIKKIINGIENFSKDLGSRIKINSKDEFGLIVFKFNEMAARIESFVKGLEKKVRERTISLEKANQSLEESNQKLKELNEMRKNFVSYTAHELKAPLNVFRWSFELLRNEDLGKINLKQREVIDQVYSSNERLVSLVNDLLDVSRLDEARMKIEKVPQQIEDIIDEVAGSLAIKIRTKKLDLRWKKPDQPLPKVLADKDRILQVILNIFGNAVKFSPPGKKIKINVSLSDKMAPSEIEKRYGFIGKDGKYVTVCVSDQGPGIPEEERKKIFTRFFRGSNVKDKIEGTGLGLFIVFEIIKLHKGAIWFESQKDKGTTFYFTLPVA